MESQQSKVTFADLFARDIDKKINRLPLGYFDNSSFGDILSRVTNDVDTIGNSMQQSVSMVVQSVCMLVRYMGEYAEEYSGGIIEIYR